MVGLALLAALLSTALLVHRVGTHVSRFRAGREEGIHPWMTLPYVARAYGVPPEVLFAAVGMPPDSGRARPIGRIAREQHRPVGAVIADINAAIAQYYARPPEMPAAPPVPPAPSLPTMPALPEEAP